jgi:hypothetical protein
MPLDDSFYRGQTDAVCIEFLCARETLKGIKIFSA